MLEDARDAVICVVLHRSSEHSPQAEVVQS
jgi:hypothetical protein